MTIQEAIDGITELKPHAYTDLKLAGWLSNLDRQIWRDVISWHENTAVAVDYDDDGVLITDMPEPDKYEMVAGVGEAPDTAPDVTLMVGEPYTDLYLMYLAAQIDYWNGEIGRYNNSMTMYNSKLAEYGNDYNRTHTPKQPVQNEI